MKLISEFIEKERHRFSGRHNNLFAMSISQISEYFAFLAIILQRYNDVSEKHIAHVKTFHAMLVPGHNALNEEHHRMRELIRVAQVDLHLQIESFYLFAKILLDRVARAIEFYFGKCHGLSLDSHDDLAKKYQRFTVAKGLGNFPDRLIYLIKELKVTVSDFRDYQIAHEKSPRTIKGTAYLEGNNASYLIVSRIYPGENDEQVTGKPLPQIMMLLEEYIAGIIEYISENNDKTALVLKAQE